MYMSLLSIIYERIIKYEVKYEINVVLVFPKFGVAVCIEGHSYWSDALTLNWMS